MQPVLHHSTTHVLAPGQGAPAGCESLPVTRGNWYGTPSQLSYWQPTGDELRLLNAGRPVLIAVAGQKQPPLAITVDDPSHYGTDRAYRVQALLDLLCAVEAKLATLEQAAPDASTDALRGRLMSVRASLLACSDAELEEVALFLSSILQGATPVEVGAHDVGPKGAL